MERECSALGGLFQTVIGDMKVTKRLVPPSLDICRLITGGGGAGGGVVEVGVPAASRRTPQVNVTEMLGVQSSRNYTEPLLAVSDEEQTKRGFRCWFGSQRE